MANKSRGVILRSPLWRGHTRPRGGDQKKSFRRLVRRMEGRWWRKYAETEEL